MVVPTNTIIPYLYSYHAICRSQWPRGLNRGSAAARLLGMRVRILPGAWMFVCCECCELSGRGLCDGLITRPEESNRLWCVVVCDLDTSWIRGPWPTGGTVAPKTKNTKFCRVFFLCAIIRMGTYLTLVSTVMNIWVIIRGGNFKTSWTTVSVSRSSPRRFTSSHA